MMTESTKDGRWPRALMQKDMNLMIRLRFRSEMEKRYGQEVQKLCQTSGFGLACSNKGDVDRGPLEMMVTSAKETAPLLTSLMLSVGPLSKSAVTSHLTSMKLLAILVILCRSAHRNNSNYFPLLVSIYLYSAGAKVDAITFLNHLGLSVSYNVLLKKLRNITSSSAAFIKEQASNCKLVGTWDNFEYRENVSGERIGDIVKFRSITMALWIKNGWKIPSTGLKQWMWDPKRGTLDPWELTMSVFGPEAMETRIRCTRFHRFKAFQAAFPAESLSFPSASMPVINKIDCKTEGNTEAFAYAPSMFSESSTAGNISVFEDLNINQMGIEKTDPRWNDWLTIWWGDLKTEIQMLGMQINGTGMHHAYDRYQHIFPGLALWHLRFNYLKMVWELFYPGGSATERSTLQWAADHWHRDKTIRPTDFHSLEDLTVHSYRARVIAILKPWFQEQSPKLRLHDKYAFGKWISQMTPLKWVKAFHWLDQRMEKRTDPGEIWNDHWNNHVRFCGVMEPYMTLCYAIKHGDIGLLRHALREVAVIFQAPAAKKPKYAKALLRQIHIIDTKAVDPILQAAYLANALVNPRGLPQTFYEMNLLLEHQNGEFKRFRADRGSSLQESDELFRLHALSVNALRKVRTSMNRIVIGRERDGKHPQKDASFDILSLADQLHRSKSTDPKGPEQGKIYFSENQVPDLIDLGQAYLHRAVSSYNEAVERGQGEADTDAVASELDGGQNESIDELFNQAREEALVTSEVSELFI